MEKHFQKREAITGHAVCSPSQLYRIMACPGSVYESVKAPITPPSTYAQHGTMLHDIVRDTITQKPSAKFAFQQLELEDKNYVEDCLDYAYDLIKTCNVPEVAVETSVELKDWGITETWGTLDLRIWDKPTLHIIDWKFGSGVPVAVEKNEQMLAYAAGCVNKSNYSPDSKVVLHLVQPPLNYYGTWELTQHDLAQWVTGVLKPALDRAIREPDPPLIPGEKQCRFCPAAMTCKARLDAARETAKEVFRVYSNLAVATKEELSNVLKRIREVNVYASQIEKYAAAELAHGRSFPGFKLVAGRAIRKWSDEKRAEAWLLGNSSIKEEDLYTKKFLSPAQAEKLDRYLKKSDDFKELVIKPDGAPKFVPEEDKRPAIEPNAEAAKVFGEWQEGEDD